MSSTCPPTPTPPDPLDPQAERAAGLIAAGRTLDEAAAEMGVGRSTVIRLLQQPGARQLVRDLRVAAAAAATSVLLAEAREAARRMAELSRCGGKDDAVRLRACALVIELAFRGAEVGDLADEVQELRALIEQHLPTAPAPDSPPTP